MAPHCKLNSEQVKMLVYLVASVLLTVVLADSAAPDPKPDSTRIVGGEDADIKTYPYQVLLQAAGRLKCGGSIISKDYVLTAGHCVDPDKPTSSLRIRAGSNYAVRNGSIHLVEKLTRHEHYRMSCHGAPMNDLALLKVVPPFNISESIQPIPLYGINEQSSVGEMGVVTGWGSTTNGSFSIQLQAVTVPLIGRGVCSKAYRKDGGLYKGQLCAGYYGIGGKDACQGDSGGPLAIRGRLAGVISWGVGCAEPKHPGVFVQIAYYRKWINEHANLL